MTKTKHYDRKSSVEENTLRLGASRKVTLTWQLWTATWGFPEPSDSKIWVSELRITVLARTRTIWPSVSSTSLRVILRLPQSWDRKVWVPRDQELKWLCWRGPADPCHPLCLTGLTWKRWESFLRVLIEALSQRQDFYAVHMYVTGNCSSAHLLWEDFLILFFRSRATVTQIFMSSL
jgi:hypothetical protein